LRREGFTENGSEEPRHVDVAAAQRQQGQHGQRSGDDPRRLVGMGIAAVAPKKHRKKARKT